ncbi:Converts alpha-aldose to the beta-anomer [Coemansia sp. RSA 1933]|nr:Converts alpha-aldose to the beta-anomer [Coemansia sp. RSA 1933]
MGVSKHNFSKNGSINEYELTNSVGTSISVTTWGARLTRFVIRDTSGKLRDIVAGFDNYESWQESLAIDDPYFGATIGRVAGRIWPCDSVQIDGKACVLPEIQPEKVCLHGGRTGFDKRVFIAQVLTELQPASVRFTYVSPDGEEGFPGEVELSVTYSLHDDNSMHIEYSGRLNSGNETILNPTNHTYWNLTGFEDPTIHNHVCSLEADRYMATRDDNVMVPTGELCPVKDTVLDFHTQPRRFGDDVEGFDKNTVRGYDHVFAVSDQPADDVRLVARVWSPQSKLMLSVLSDQPALIVYTGNWISPKLVGKHGIRYGNYTAVALETQRFPNAVNIPQFRNQVLLHPDKPFGHHTVYKVEYI